VHLPKGRRDKRGGGADIKRTVQNKESFLYLEQQQACQEQRGDTPYLFSGEVKRKPSKENQKKKLGVTENVWFQMGRGGNSCRGGLSRKGHSAS